MTEDHALLAAIAADPKDDTVRLAYADFLQENGDSDRAEFIRNQVEMARISPNDPARRPLVIRNVHFLREFVPQWRTQLPELPGIEWGDFERGLVEEVQADTPGVIVRHAAAIFAEPAIHVIRFARFTQVKTFAAMPQLKRVRVLRLVRAKAGPEALRNLFASPHLDNLAILELDENQAGDQGAVSLAETDLPSLVELCLGANGIGNAGGQALAASTYLQNLRFLDLRLNRIGDPAVRAALVRRFGSRVKL